MMTPRTASQSHSKTRSRLRYSAHNAIAFAALLLVCATASAADKRVFEGEYNWFDGGTGPLTAEFKSTGPETFDVVFRFTFSGDKKTWKGTAMGPLTADSDINGKTKWSGRDWVFEARLEEGALKGTHREMRSDGGVYETGTFSLVESSSSAQGDSR